MEVDAHQDLHGVAGAHCKPQVSGVNPALWAENLAEMNHPGLTPGQDIIRPLDNPIKKTGHLLMMYGNLCPGGGVAKITGKEGETFTVSEFMFSDGYVSG